MSQTLLVTVTGTDRAGVTTRLLDALSAAAFSVVDIEQIVVRDQLVLSLLLSTEGATDQQCQQARDAVSTAATELNLRCEIQSGAAEQDDRRRGRLIVTVIGNPLDPAELSAIAAAVSETGGNIDRIVRVACRPVTAIELVVSGADLARLRTSLTSVASEVGVDLSVQRPGLARRGARLVVMDVDSTLIQDEVIELIAAHAGCADEVAEVTERAMAGELDFAESLAQRVALLRGVPESALAAVGADVRLTPGARTLCRTLNNLGYHIALVSGGFHEVVDPIATELGIQHVRANRLEIADGLLTGRTTGPVVDRAGKAAALEEFAAAHGVSLERTVAIGDGANDLDMLTLAGLGIAFNAKPLVRAQADVAVNVPYLDSVLFLLGIPREEIELADAAPGT